MDNGSPPERKKFKISFNKTKKNAILINVLLLILIITAALLSPVFAVKTIVISGNSRLTDEKITAASGIIEKKNIFLFRTSRAEEGVAALSFVEAVTIRRKFPSSVLIDITERKPAAQVSLSDSIYIIIDKNGRILDTTPEKLRYSIPTIENVTVEEFSIGDTLRIADETHYNIMFSILHELIENEMWTRTKRIYHIDSYRIEYSDGIICDLEKGNDIPYKIKFLKEAIAKIPEGQKGTIEFVDNYKAVFKPDEKQ